MKYTESNKWITNPPAQIHSHIYPDRQNTNQAPSKIEMIVLVPQFILSGKKHQSATPVETAENGLTAVALVIQAAHKDTSHEPLENAKHHGPEQSASQESTLPIKHLNETFRMLPISGLHQNRLLLV